MERATQIVNKRHPTKKTMRGQFHEKKSGEQRSCLAAFHRTFYIKLAPEVKSPYVEGGWAISIQNLSIEGAALAEKQPS